MDLDAKKRQVIDWIDSDQMTESQIMDALSERSNVENPSPDAREWRLLMSAALQDFDRFEEFCRNA